MNMHVGERKDAAIALVGFGVEGRSTFGFLLRNGISPDQITILDMSDSLDYPEGVRRRTGPDYLNTETVFDVIFLSPGVTRKKRKGTRLEIQHDETVFTSQIDYFLKNYPGVTVGVTGTKGKSTTATFLYELLRNAGKSVALAGNIGDPALDIFAQSELPDIVILEISSYMLEAVHHGVLSYGVFTSLHEAHIDGHGTAENYVSTKLRLVEFSSHCLVSMQTLSSGLLSSAQKEFIDKRIAAGSAALYGSEGTYFFRNGMFVSHREPVCSDASFSPLGDHMRRNVSCGLGLCEYFSIPYSVFEQTLCTFKSLEHRIEFVGTFTGIDRYNDSFATTTESVAAAITTLGPSLKTIFVGGYDNGAAIDALVAAIRKSDLENIVLFPDTGARLREALRGGSYIFFETNNLQEAVQRAATQTPAGSRAVLSCGFPSFTMRKNYKERGRDFKRQVQALGK